MSQNTEAVNDLSKTVVSKSALKQQISKILRSLLRLLEANYPDTFESKCREFGFVRELY